MTASTRRLINSKEEFRSIKNAAKERCGRIQSNNFSGERAIEDALANNTVSYEECDEGFLVFLDEGPYERLLYYLAIGDSFPRIKSKKPLLLDEIDANDRRRSFLDELSYKLVSAGWVQVADNLQVEEDLEVYRPRLAHEMDSVLEKLRVSGLELMLCDEAYSSQVLEMWEKYLRVTDIPGSHLKFVDDPKQNVVCVVNARGELCGANWWECHGGFAEIRHTVTHVDYRHRGIGYATLTYALNDALAKGCKKAFTYIDRRNSKSIALYKKAGIVANGKTSIQFVLDKESPNGRNA